MLNGFKWKERLRGGDQQYGLTTYLFYACLCFDVLFSSIASAQHSSNDVVRIDTVIKEFKIPQVINHVSHVPQVNGNIPKAAKRKINDRLKKYFIVTGDEDSAAYIRSLLEDTGAPDLATLIEHPEEYGELDVDDRTESFSFPMKNEAFLSFTYTSAFYPKGGQLMFFNDCDVFDPETGEMFSFVDLFSANSEELIRQFDKYGFYVEQMSIPDTPFVRVPATRYMYELGEYINDVFQQKESRCTSWYLLEEENEIYLMLNVACGGPYPAEYGISLRNFKPYLTHPYLRNRYKSWGDNIFTLKGQLLRNDIDSIIFDNYTVRNGGGQLVHSTPGSQDLHSAISYWHSDSSYFFRLDKFLSAHDNSKVKIQDVLEIKKSDIKPEWSILESCEMKDGSSLPIIAIVKENRPGSKLFTKILKAWSADADTGKFIPLNPRDVKICRYDGEDD